MPPDLNPMWNPPPNVTEHQGAPLAADCDFFAPPPPDIGPIKTAHTSLKQGMKPKSTVARLSIALAWGAALEILLLVIYRTVGFPWFRFDGDSDPPVALVFAPVTLVAAAIAWLFVRFRHTCGYVGNDGIAYFTCRRQRAKIEHLWTFHFKDAASLVTSTTHHFKNTAYTHTNFGFYWYSSPHAKSLFGLKDSHRSHLAGPPPENLYHFCRSAESAWYNHLAPLMEAELAQKGRVSFYTGHKPLFGKMPAWRLIMRSRMGMARSPDWSQPTLATHQSPTTFLRSPAPGCSSLYSILMPA